MKIIKVSLLAILASLLIVPAFAQQGVTVNKNLSIGSYGRAGIARSNNSLYPRSLNLHGMGSVGGRMEEADYFELLTALHFTPVTSNSDTTTISFSGKDGSVHNKWTDHRKCKQ
jgi:maltoporin